MTKKSSIKSVSIKGYQPSVIEGTECLAILNYFWWHLVKLILTYGHPRGNSLFGTKM